MKTVRELIYKRGFGKVDRRRTPLTENSIIENVSTIMQGFLGSALKAIGRALVKQYGIGYGELLSRAVLWSLVYILLFASKTHFWKSLICWGQC